MHPSWNYIRLWSFWQADVIRTMLSPGVKLVGNLANCDAHRRLVMQRFGLLLSYLIARTIVGSARHRRGPTSKPGLADEADITDWHRCYFTPLAGSAARSPAVERHPSHDARRDRGTETAEAKRY